MNLSNPQKELLDLIYNVILNQETTEKERKAFKNAKDRIESGKKFDSEISELLKELMYIPNSRPVDEFTEEARKECTLVREQVVLLMVFQIIKQNRVILSN